MELRTTVPRDELFWKKVQVGGEDDCWPWTGAITRQGYGHIRRKGKLLAVHRYAYAQLYVEVPHGWRVENVCGTVACCNPKHMRVAPARPTYTYTPLIVKKTRKGTSNMADPRDATDPYLTVKEMAERLGISEEKMRGFIHEGDLPVFRIGSGTSGGIRVRTSAFEKWLRTRERSQRNA